jgi:uncharacterized protein
VAARPDCLESLLRYRSYTSRRRSRPAAIAGNTLVRRHLPSSALCSVGRMLAVEFEWDPGKAAENLSKHKVSFTEATTVFGDFLGTTLADPDHSGHERRFLTIGLSGRNRLLIVSHTERGDQLRIISARRLTPNERRAYESERQEGD